MAAREHAVTQGLHLLIEDKSSKRVQVIRAKSSGASAEDFEYFILGRRFSLPSSVTRAADLRHRLVPQRGASVLPFCRSTTPRLRGSPLLYDLLSGLTRLSALRLALPPLMPIALLSTCKPSPI